MRSGNILSWFPETAYYLEHADRLAYSFSNLLDIRRGFRCLCVGSWGAEAPYLIEELGAAYVICIRAPEDGLPPFERREISVPGRAGNWEVDLYSLDVETEQFPSEIGTVDLVLCWEVLEHLCVNPPHMLWQAINALSVGGVVSVTTPNALWHYYTTAQIYGQNALGLKLQPHIPFATHWRLYSPSEVCEMLEAMGCSIVQSTSFLRTEPFSLKSRVFLWFLDRMRRKSRNGDCSYGQHVYVTARKQRSEQLYQPTWLFPETSDGGSRIDTEHEVLTS